MAVVYMDGFDYYDKDFLGVRGWTASGGIAATPFGRFGGNAMFVSNRYIYRYLPANYTTGFVGCAVYLGGANAGRVLALLDSGAIQVDVYFNPSTKLFYMRRGGDLLGSTGTTIATAATQTNIGQWVYVELGGTIDNTTGSMEMRLNGQPSFMTFSGDTQRTGNAYFNGIGFDSDGDVYYIDDIYATDTTGGSPTNTFLGDVRVQAIFPNGNGNSSQFVGSDANSVDNYLLVDETNPDSDTTYVESNVVGNKDTYAFSTVSASVGTVFAVQPVPYAKKTDSGTRSMKTIARLSGTETDGPERFLGSSYSFYPDIRETKPGGGVWSITDIGNAEFGQKVFA